MEISISTSVSVATPADVGAAITASISGLTTNPTYGSTAQIGVALTGALSGLEGGEVVVPIWTLDDTPIPGATTANYTPTTGDNLGVLRYAPTVDGNPVTSAPWTVRHAPPTVNAAASVAGSLAEGGNLTGTPATFNGSDVTIANLWEISDDGSTGWTSTGNTTTTSPDLVEGKYYRFVSTGTSSGGAAVSASAAAGPVVDFSVSIVNDGIEITGGASPYTVTVTDPADYTPGSPYTVDTSGIGSGPVEVYQPDITGTLETGNALTALDPLYFFNGTDSIAYQWQRDTGSGFADISGATAATLTDVQNDTAGDVRRKTTITDDNGSTDIYTNEPTVASGAPVDIVATLFGSSEDGFYYDTRDNTDLYVDESLTGGNPSDGDQFGGLVDSSGNGKTGEQDVVARRPRWREAAKAFETDGAVTDPTRIDGANAGGNSFTTTMTFMCAFKLLNGNDSVVFGTGGTSGIGFVRINDAELIFSSCGTPTLYLDGVAQDTATAAIKATLQDGNFHLIEIRNLDMATDSRWNDGLSFGVRGNNTSTPTSMQMGSPVLTSNNTPADIVAARQYYVQNHGVTLA